MPGAEQAGPLQSQRAKDAKLKQRMKTVHTIVYQSLLQEGPIEQRAQHDQLVEKLETMSTAPFHNLKVLGGLGSKEGGVNTTVRADVYDDKKNKITVYMKATGGETVYDREGFPVIKNPASGEWERIPLQKADAEYKKLIRTWSSPEYFETYAIAMKEKYGISDEGFSTFKESLRSEIGSARLGIEPGGSAVREKVVYDQAMMLGIDVISPTVLRELKGQAMIRGEKVDVSNLVSIQEEIKSETGKPGRELYQEELMALLLQPINEWKKVFGFNDEQLKNMVDSIAAGAAIHYWTGQLDGHQENMQILDTGKIKFLDSGLSYSKKRGVDVKYKQVDVSGSTGSSKRKMEMGDDTQPYHLMRSVPMEILSNHPEIRLPDHIREKMRQQYEKVLDPESAEHQAQAQMFKALFPDVAVARVEMHKYVARLKHLVDHGRPPEEAFASDQLYPIGIMRFMHAKGREQAEQEAAKRAEQEEAARVAAEFDTLLKEQAEKDAVEEEVDAAFTKITSAPRRRPPPPPPSRSSRPPAG